MTQHRWVIGEGKLVVTSDSVKVFGQLAMDAASEWKERGTPPKL